MEEKWFLLFLNSIKFPAYSASVALSGLVDSGFSNCFFPSIEGQSPPVQWFLWICGFPFGLPIRIPWEWYIYFKAHMPGPHSGVYESSPGDCIERPGFRTTALNPHQLSSMTFVQISIDGFQSTLLVQKRLAAVQNRWVPNRVFLFDVMRKIKLLGDKVNISLPYLSSESNTHRLIF